MIDKYDEYFTGGMGAEAVRELVQLVDLKAEMDKLENDLESKSAQRRSRARAGLSGKSLLCSNELRSCLELQLHTPMVRRSKCG